MKEGKWEFLTAAANQRPLTLRKEATIPFIKAVWLGCLNNSFQCLNNNNTFDTYFYNTQTRIFKTLKTKQQYLNTVTKRAQVIAHISCFTFYINLTICACYKNSARLKMSSYNTTFLVRKSHNLNLLVFYYWITNPCFINVLCVWY